MSFKSVGGTKTTGKGMMVILKLGRSAESVVKLPASVAATSMT